jgi:hypothetical protein
MQTKLVKHVFRLPKNVWKYGVSFPT